MSTACSLKALSVAAAAASIVSLSACPLLPPSQNPDQGTWFRLRTEHHGERRCLESGDGIQGIHMAACGNYSGQIWQAVPVPESEGWLQLRSEFQGADRCLTGNSPESAEHFGAAYMVSCSDAADQQWEFVEDGDGYLLRTAFHGANECLDANRLGGEDHDGFGFMSDCTSADTQRWLRADAIDPLELGLIRHEIVTETAWLGGDPVDAVCPVGKVVIGGGARWPGMSALVSEDRPVDRRTWRLVTPLWNGGEATVYAICVDEASAPGYEIVDASGTHPNGGATLEATCPDGKVAVGGGSTYSPSADQALQILLDNDRPTGDRGWLIGGYSETGGDWAAHVVCVDAAAVPGREIVTSTGDHPTGEDVQLVIECPEGKKVLAGGGYWFTGTDVTQMPIVVRSGDHPATDDSWSLQATSDAGGEWWSQAVCATVD